MESHTSFKGVFSADKVTKYWRNQKQAPSKSMFVDNYFPPTENSLLGKDSSGNWIDQIDGEKKSQEINYKDIEWKRSHELFDNCLLFDDKIECSDIKQGNLGNCYFLSAIAAITELPHLIYQIFRNKEVSPEGYYEVVLFMDGEWQIVFVDDYFPVKKGTKELSFARPNGCELWVILLEKAWAKVNGGYANIISGWPSDPLAALTGFATQKLTHKDMDLEELWKIIKLSDLSDNIMCTSTKNDGTVEKYGLVINHAYTLIGAGETEYNGAPLRLVHIRNPWGYKEWNGDWSDSSKLWTADLDKYFGRVNIDDGTFFMSFDDFCNLYECTHVCHVMYDSNIKSFHIDSNLNKPHVFNLFLQENAKIAISIVTNHWRFHRELKYVTHPFSIVVGKYDMKNRKLTRVDGDFLAYENLEYVQNFEKGLYVVWVYCAHAYCKDPKPASYQVRFISPTKYRVRHENIDSGFELIRELIITGVQEKFHDKIATTEQYFGIENSFRRTGIGYRCAINNSSTKYMKWTNNPAEIQKMAILPPHDGKDSFDFLVPPMGYGICLGIRNDQWGTYWFNLKSSYLNYNCKEGEDPTKTSKINLEHYVNPEVGLDEIDDNYYDYYSSSHEEAKKSLQFEHINSQAIAFEELKKEYPNLKLLDHLSPTSNDSNLNWGVLKYDNGEYIGQFLPNKTREGRGLYHWANDKIYYAGYWHNNLREQYGKLLDENFKLIYEGEYSKGLKHGKGKLNFNNGDVYEGDYISDKREGNAVYTWKDGSKWKGPFVNNQMNGMGIYTPADGSESWEVEYKNGQYVG